MCGVSGERVSNGLLHQQSARLASALRRRGFQPGDFLAVVSPNHVLYPALFLAATINGGSLTPANPMYTKGQSLGFTHRPMCACQYLKVENTTMRRLTETFAMQENWSTCYAHRAPSGQSLVKDWNNRSPR